MICGCLFLNPTNVKNALSILRIVRLFGKIKEKAYLCTALEGVAEVVLQPSNRQQGFIMNWIILFVAGLCEVGFTYCLGRAKSVVGLEWWAWIGGFLLFSVLSMVLLAKATQTLPLGTAYPVWTGIGAIGTVLVGIFVFQEPATFWRLFFISTLILSIVGLKSLS